MLEVHGLHLKRDVYKRQPLSSASLGRILVPQILVRLACVKHAASAVSYTHLDVYKRQCNA